MTENEVIEKLEFFKKAIINLKNENSSLSEAASNSEIGNGKTIENYEKQILSLKEENKKLNKELEKIDKKWSNEYNNLKNKTYLTIKHLVEEVVEPKEKQSEEVNKRIVELENLLFEKNKFLNRANNLDAESASKMLKERRKYYFTIKRNIFNCNWKK